MKNILRTALLASMSILGQNVMGQVANALDFDGVDDKVDCGNDTSIQITGKYITLEAWIYPTAWKTNAYDGNVINKEYNTSNYGFMLRCGAGGKLNFAIGDGSWHEITTANPVLSLNTWQHIAGTYDGAMMRLYLNGAAIDSLSVSTTISNATGTPLLLGAHTTYVRFYQGMIDEVRVWNICRSQPDLSYWMNREICSKLPQLRGYYKFNLGKAAQPNPFVKKLTDMSRYGNNGTLSGFTLTGLASNWEKGQSLAKDVVSVSDTVVICDKYTSPSRKFSWNKSGVYYDTIPTVMQCDSAITVYLTIKKSSSKAISAYGCTSYTSPSGLNTWTKSGVYYDYLKNYVKCDSVLTITLTIGGGRDTIYPKTCSSFKVPSGKKTYTVSGHYVDTIPNYRNCDSIIDIYLTANKPSTRTLSTMACYSYTSPSGKHTWTQSGVYYDTLKNYTGCDSFMTVTLKILASSSIKSYSVCNKMQSPSNKYTWTQTGIYIDTITNYAGCDSVITVNLTVRKTTFSTQDISSCRFFVSHGKKRIWTTSGTYMDTMANHEGCDSIMTINLTIHRANTSVSQNRSTLTAASLTGTYQWLNCDQNFTAVPGETQRIFTATANGNYALQISDSLCTDTSVCYEITTVGLVKTTAINQFIVYPNPGSGTFNIVLPYICHDVVIKVRDISGKLVYTGTYESLSECMINFDCSKGIYLLEIHAADFNGTQYLSVE